MDIILLDVTLLCIELPENQLDESKNRLLHNRLLRFTEL